ncbi:MAG: DUF47 family protein [Candidatus Bathyarchaeia archaeon]
MATAKLLIWFERRRKSKTLNLAHQQISLAMSTVEDLNLALKAFSEGKRVEMEEAIKQLFSREAKADELRRTIYEELTRQNLPNKYREDLKELVRYLDHFADEIKDSARNLKVIGWPVIPRAIFEQYLKISEILVQCVRALRECFESLGASPLSLKDKADQVAYYEDRVDEEYLQTKILFIKNRKELPATTLIGLRDLLECLERSADILVRTADYLRMISVSELP